jgi:hypothetical protein
VRKRWQFCWCDEDSPPTNGDAHAWRSKVFRAATFEKAMDKMLAFILSQRCVCLVDYEAHALHVPYSVDRHEDTFNRIDRTSHELADYRD